MTDTNKTSDEALRQARLQALAEATAEAQRLAGQWSDEAEDTHSDHQKDLRRAWADAARRVAEAIEALDRTGGTA